MTEIPFLPNHSRKFRWEGQVNEGDLMFVPQVGIHVFESVGASFGLRFVNHDYMAASYGRELLSME